ncbi:DUF4236 domain-containing protein [Neisseriaceae bacterium ESL0693]|nr:DUF4236 domain-containing protein [Neisseriaceae bacterium ESL0693]
MGWRFRKSIKVLPGVRINIGKQGITSATIGRRGASINIGKKGTSANLGIPGTGLSYCKSFNKKERVMARGSKINQLEKLERMYRLGQITDSDYIQLKTELMGYPNIEIPARKGCFHFIWMIIKWFIITAIGFIVLALFLKEDPSKAKKNSPKDNSYLEQQPTSQSDYKQDLGKEAGHLDDRKQEETLDNLF